MYYIIDVHSLGTEKNGYTHRIAIHIYFIFLVKFRFIFHFPFEYCFRQFSAWTIETFLTQAIRLDRRLYHIFISPFPSSWQHFIFMNKCHLERAHNFKYSSVRTTKRSRGVWACTHCRVQFSTRSEWKSLIQTWIESGLLRW